jgi:hypothetical protein
MEHSFSVQLATKHGIEKAIILKNIDFWIKKNKANNKHYYKGRYWTYNSYAAFSEIFPYIKAKRMGFILREMEVEGLLLVGNFNNSSYDRTKWYTLKSLDYRESNIGTLHDPKSDNGTSENGQPIPDNKPDNKHIRQQPFNKNSFKAGSDKYCLKTESTRKGTDALSIVDQIVAVRSEKSPIRNKEAFKLALIKDLEKNPSQLKKWTDEIATLKNIEDRKTSMSKMAKNEINNINKIKKERETSILRATDLAFELSEDEKKEVMEEAFLQAKRLFKNPPKAFVLEIFSKLILDKNRQLI